MSGPGSNRWLLPLTVFCTAALAGWWQVDLAGNPAATDRPAVSPRSARPPRTVHQPSRPAVPDYVRKLLAPLRAARTPEERQRAAIQLALALPVAELAAWYDAKWYPAGDGMDSSVFYRITRQRWLDEDPAGYLNRALVKQPRDSNEAAYQWANRDPEAALGWLRELADPRDLNRVAPAVYRSLAKVRPALALAEILQVQRRMGATEGTVDAMLESLAGNAADALRKAATTWPAELSQRADRALTNDLLKRDFAAGVGELSGREDGRALFLKAVGRYPKIGGALLDQVASLPAGWFAAAVEQSGTDGIIGDHAARWLEMDLAALGLDEKSAVEFRTKALTTLATKDPAAAFAALENSALDPQGRQDTWDTIFRQLARLNPAAARAMMSQLSDPEAVARCEQALAPPKSDGLQPKPATATEWVANLAKPEPDTNLFIRSDTTASAWDRSALAEARSSFAQLPDDQKARAASQLSLGQGIDEMPELRADAFRWMLENPPSAPAANATADRETNLLRNASKLATDWARDDPQAASRWAQSLPAGDTRLWVMKNVAKQWAEYEPSSAAAWARTLPAAERAAVEAHLAEESK